MPAGPVYPTALPLGDWARNPARGCVQPGVNPNVFFPSYGDHAATVAARRICKACPVRRECLADALNHPWVKGVWGGTTRAERRARRLPHWYEP